MKQDPAMDARFTVASGEKATVTVQSVQCNCETSAGYDGSPLERQHHIPDVYAFTVTGDPGSVKYFACSCQFPPGTPVTAHYTISVKGDGGPGYSVTPVYMETEDAAFQLRFTIQ